MTLAIAVTASPALPSPGSASDIATTSPPAQNAGPAASSKIAVTVGSPVSSTATSRQRRPISKSTAFRRAGRFKVTCARPSSTSTRMESLISASFSSEGAARRRSPSKPPVTLLWPPSRASPRFTIRGTASHRWSMPAATTRPFPSAPAVGLRRERRTAAQLLHWGSARLVLLRVRRGIGALARLPELDRVVPRRVVGRARRYRVLGPACVPGAATHPPHPHDDLRAGLLHRTHPNERRPARRSGQPCLHG